MDKKLVLLVVLYLRWTCCLALTPRTFKMGLLIPWSQDVGEFSGRTSAAAVSIAIDRINSDLNMNAGGAFQLR